MKISTKKPNFNKKETKVVQKKGKIEAKISSASRKEDGRKTNVATNPVKKYDGENDSDEENFEDHAFYDEDYDYKIEEEMIPGTLMNNNQQMNHSNEENKKKRKDPPRIIEEIQEIPRKDPIRPLFERLRNNKWIKPNVQKFTFLEFQLNDCKKINNYNGQRGENFALFGSTKDGTSICVISQQYFPYFLVESPFIQENQKELGLELLNLLDSFESNGNKSGNNLRQKMVVSIDIVKGSSIHGYNQAENPNIPKTFFRINCNGFTERTILMSLFRQTKAKACNMMKFFNEKISTREKERYEKFIPNFSNRFVQIRGKFFKSDVFETSLPIVNQFLNDINLGEMQWLRIEEFDYKLVDDTYRISKSQIEIETNWKKLKKVDHDFIAATRMLSFDIECLGKGSRFPDAEFDPVIQIGCVLSDFDSLGKEAKQEKFSFVLGSCDEIENASVFSFENEKDLLLGFLFFLNRTECDVIMGYNSNQFDWPYLFKRAEKTEIPSFCYFGKLKKEKVEAKEKFFESRAHGRIKQFDITISGVFLWDIYIHLRKNFKYPSYKLNDVADKILGLRKIELAYENIPKFHQGTSSDRALIAKYCVQDSVLPQLIANKLNLYVGLLQMASISKILRRDVIERGQQIKVLTLTHICARENGYFIADQSFFRPKKNFSYQGATVISPEIGFYQGKVDVLDFASLYPSIISAFNLCFCTFNPSNGQFVPVEIRKGILPMVVEQLMSKRSSSKKKMAEAKERNEKNEAEFYDQQQLATKVVANSVYGFCGTSTNKIYNESIAAKVTENGRKMLEDTKNYIMKNYTKEFKDLKIIYGDTDSVMIYLGDIPGKFAIEKGKQMAAEITKALFKPPIKLEFEKFYAPMLLLKKKGYAGWFWDNDKAPTKLDVKGLELVRRNSPQLIKDCLGMILKSLMKYVEDEKGAFKVDLVANFKEIFKSLEETKFKFFNQQLPIEKFIMSTNNTKEKCKNLQPHEKVIQDIIKREGEDKAPSLGERIPYLICCDVKNQKKAQKAQEPFFAIREKLPLDLEYYWNYLMSVVKRTIGIALPESFENDFKQLLKIPQNVRNFVPTNSISKFFIKKKKCPNCLTFITDKELLCGKCLTEKEKIKQCFQDERNQLQEEETKLLKICYKCQGMEGEILCEQKSCNIFLEKMIVNHKKNDFDKSAKSDLINLI